MKNKLLVYLMCVALVLTAIFVSGCDSNVDVEAITITSAGDVTEIETGKVLQLFASVTPYLAPQEVTWSSSDTAKATVDANGLVTAVAAGNVTITATSVANDQISKKFPLIINAAAPVVDNTPKTVALTTANNVTTVKVDGTLKITATVSPAAASQEVTWESSDMSKATVSNGLVSAIAEGTVVITATSKSVSTVKNSITITITADEVEDPSDNYSKMEFSTHAQYMAIANNELLKVKGVVTFIEPTDADTVNYYLQNGEDAFYIYGQDTTKFPVELGKVYAVGGAKTVYRTGTHEIKTIEYCEELQESITYTAANINGKDVSSADEMYPYHGAFVTGNAVVATTPSTGNAYNISVKVGDYSTNLRVESKYMSADELTALNNKVATMVAGASVEFTGILTHYGNGNYKAPQIYILSADALTVSEASAADKVAMVKDAIKLVGFVSADADTITLPSTVAAFTDVQITWASDNTSIVTSLGAVTHPANDTIVTLTATVTHKTETSATATRDFKVNIAGSAFAGQQVLALDFEAANKEDLNYGVSKTKSSYQYKDAAGNYTDEANTVTIGSDSWILNGTLISTAAGGDHCGGDLAGRMSNKQGKVQTTVAGEYNYVQFDVATYNAQQHGTTVTVMYKMQDGEDWVESGIIISVDSYILTTYRVALEAGVKDIKICVVSGSGAVNIDNIVLYK